MKSFYTILVLVLFANAQAQIISTYAGAGGAAGFTVGTWAGDSGLAIAARLNAPYKLCSDGNGNLFVADCGNHCVRKIDANGIITTIAGRGSPGFSGDGGPATMADLDYPSGLCFDPSGNLFIADFGNNRVRKIGSNGIISTVAGSGLRGFGSGSYSGDGGPAVAATLDAPIGVIVDAAGNLFIADTYNHRIRRVDAVGTITTIAGTGLGSYNGDGIPAGTAMLYYPSDLEFSPTGDLLIADYLNHRIRKIDAAGTITTVAGSFLPGFSGDGGPAVNAELDNPVDISKDNSGNLYISDLYNQRIRKVDAAGIITTVAGTGTYGYSGDGGPATSAELFMPSATVFHNGSLYICDQANNRVRMICSSLVSTSLTASDTLIGCPNHSVILTASGAGTYTYTWSMTQQGMNNISIFPDSTRSYFVLARDSAGCYGSASQKLTVDACVGIHETGNFSQLKLFPNPARLQINIRGIPRSAPPSEIIICDTHGRVLKSTTNNTGSTENGYTIDVSDLEDGLYILRLENSDGRWTKPFGKFSR